MAAADWRHGPAASLLQELAEAALKVQPQPPKGLPSSNSSSYPPPASPTPSYSTTSIGWSQSIHARLLSEAAQDLDKFLEVRLSI